MQVQIVIDLPFIDNEGHLNEEMESKVMYQVAKAITSNIEEQLKPQIDKFMDESIQRSIDSILANYIEKPIVVSNGFKSTHYDSLYDMVEKRFGELYDAEIKRTSNSCGTDPILNRLEGKIKYYMQHQMQSISNKIELSAKEIANAALKESSLYSAIEKAGLIQK